MSDLKELLTTVREQSQAGNRKGLTTTLRTLMENRREYYRQSIAEALQEEFSDALYKMLLLELDDEEGEDRGHRSFAPRGGERRFNPNH